MKKRLKNLSENKKAVDSVLSTIATAVARSSTREKRQTGSSTSTSTAVSTSTSTAAATSTTTAAEGIAITSAASFITYTQSLITLISHDPTDYQIFVVSTQIISSTVTFSSTDIETLSSVSVTLTVAAVAIEYEITVLSEQITAITGEVLTDEDIDSFEQCTSTEDCHTTVDEAAEESPNDLKSGILVENKESLQIILTLCEAVAADAISATASGTVEMTAVSLFAIVTEVYTLISADFLYVGEISTLVLEIQSAMLTVALTDAELVEVNAIIAQLTVLIVDIEATISVVESTLTDDEKLEVLTENKESATTAMMLCEAILEDPLTATAGGTVEMTAAESFALVLNLYTLLSANYLSIEISAILIEIQAVKLTAELTDEEAAMVVDIVAKLNVLIVSIDASIQVVAADVAVITGPGGEGGGAGGDGGLPAGASKIDILTFNMESAAAAQMLCEAIALDAIAATAGGTVEMTPAESFALVFNLYTLISADFLYVGEIQTLMIQIQSVKLTVALTEAEIAEVNGIVAQLAILVVDIGSTIAVVGSPLSDEAKLDVLSGNAESATVAMMLCEAILEDPLAATAGGTVEMTAAESFALVFNLFTLLSANFLSPEISALLIEIQAVKLTEPLTDEEAAMVVDIVAQLNVLIVNIEAAILVVQVEVGGVDVGPGAGIGPGASKLDILTFNMDSAAAAQMLCEAIALDAIAATAGGTIEMTAAESFALVFNFYTLLSANFLSFEISALLIQIQSVKLTVALTEAEIADVNGIVAQLAVLVVDIGSTIAVVGSPLSDEEKADVLSENAESATVAMMLCEAILEDPLAATAGGTVEMTAAESFALVFNLYTLLSANYLSIEISALLIEIQAVKLTEPLTDEEAAMVVDIVAQLNVLIVNIEVAIQVVTVVIIVPGELSPEDEAKLEVLGENAESANVAMMLCEAILEDPLAATAEGTVEMTAAESFALVFNLYTLLSADYLSTEISAILIEIQSVKLTAELTDEEAAMVVDIVAKLNVLIISIKSSMMVIKSPLPEEVKLDVLEDNMESASTTLDFINLVLDDPEKVEGTVEMTWMQLFALFNNVFITISSDYLLHGEKCPRPRPPMGDMMESSTTLSSTGSTAGSTMMETTTASATESTTSYSMPPAVEMCMSECMGPTPMPTTGSSGTMASLMSTTMASTTSSGETTESAATSDSTGSSTGSSDSTSSSMSSSDSTGSSMASSSTNPTPGSGSSYISCLLDQIQSATLTSDLTDDEILQAEDIMGKFEILIMSIEVTIQVILAEAPPPPGQCVCLPCCPYAGMGTSNFTAMTDPFSVTGTTLSTSTGSTMSSTGTGSTTVTTIGSTGTGSTSTITSTTDTTGSSTTSGSSSSSTTTSGSSMGTASSTGTSGTGTSTTGLGTGTSTTGSGTGSSTTGSGTGTSTMGPTGYFDPDDCPCICADGTGERPVLIGYGESTSSSSMGTGSTSSMGTRSTSSMGTGSTSSMGTDSSSSTSTSMTSGSTASSTGTGSTSSSTATSSSSSGSTGTGSTTRIYTTLHYTGSTGTGSTATGSMSTGSSATSSMGTGSSTTMSTTMGLMCSPLYQNGMKPEDSDSTGTVIIIISLAIFSVTRRSRSDSVSQ